MRINRKAIGARIREHRKALDLTQARLAERADLDTIYVSQLERGERLASVEAMFRIAAALKTKPGLLLDGDPGKDDALLIEVRDLLAKWDREQRRAVLKALRALAEL